MCVYVYVYIIYIYIYRERERYNILYTCSRARSSSPWPSCLGDSKNTKNTARGCRLDIPRFKEWLN